MLDLGQRSTWKNAHVSRPDTQVSSLLHIYIMHNSRVRNLHLRILVLSFSSDLDSFDVAPHQEVSIVPGWEQMKERAETLTGRLL